MVVIHNIFSCLVPRPFLLQTASDYVGPYVHSTPNKTLSYKTSEFCNTAEKLHEAEHEMPLLDASWVWREGVLKESAIACKEKPYERSGSTLLKRSNEWVLWGRKIIHFPLLDTWEALISLMTWKYILTPHTALAANEGVCLGGYYRRKITATLLSP